mmetsp:Transcript_90105/g.179237  ORF Transcript_90105/g.179237 Transcript_90105/m.179237 type:complete len:700 (-) Transcript_90105:227-2326(-)
MANQAPPEAFAVQEDRHIDENHPYDGSGLAPRTCTDLPCMVVFLMCMLGMVCMTVYAYREGDHRRLTHGYNYRGELCGVDKKVRDKPLVYWCASGRMLESGAPAALDLDFPACVEKCPHDDTVNMACLGVEQVKVQESGEEPFITRRTVVTQSTVSQSSYPCKEFGGLYCLPHMSALGLPKDGALMRSLTDSSGPLGTPWARVTAAAGGLYRCRFLVAGCLVVAVVLGYGYLLLLRTHAEPLVKTTLLMLVVLLLVMGVYFMAGSVLRGGALEGWEARNCLFREMDQAAARGISVAVGILSFVLGLALLICACAAQEQILTALDCVEAACECIFSMPSLLVQPLLEGIWRICMAAVLISGFTSLLSTATMKANYLDIKGERVGGLTWSLSFSDEQRAMVAYFVLGGIWLLELSGALSQFVLSYSVVLWYYTPKPKGLGPNSPLIRGFVVGVIFHLGTLALGALLTCLLRPAHVLFGSLAQQVGPESKNPLCGAIAKCLSCCIERYQKYLQHLSGHAYIDVCISSASFCTAAQNSADFLAHEGGKVSALSGACFVACLAGVLGIGAVVGLLCYYCLAFSWQWAADDSPHYVANVHFVALATASLAASIAACFTLLVNHAADTLIYVFAWNKRHAHNTVQKYAPDSLADMTEYRPISKPGSTTGKQSGVLGAFGSMFQSKWKKSSEEEEHVVGPPERTLST